MNKILQSLFPNRYKYLGLYKFDRLIFQVVMFIIFIHLFYIAYHYNFSLDYFSCQSGEYIKNIGYACKNPFYTPSSWVNAEYLPNGEYGTKPGALFYSGYYVGFGLLILAFVLNHIIYNKKFKFEGVKDELDSNNNE